MPYAFSQDVPIDAATYHRVSGLIGDEPPQGMVSHVVVELPDGGLRITDVWESEEACNKFGDTRLMPALRTVLGDEMMDMPPPPREELAVVHVWQP
ncbi:MAG: hypothetical protein JWL73_2050 [Actinomycetia bacterium]|nr:hypothetical protein [Actinomycetes bacterium]